MPVSARSLISEAELVQFRTRSTLRGLWCVAHAWGVILLCCTALVLAPWWAWPVLVPLTVAIIGSRQLGLAILMHEGAHGGLARNQRLNLWISQIFCGWPIGVDTLKYRAYHFRHHAHTQSDQDPDLVLSAPFPVTPESLQRKLLRDLTGRTGLKQRGAQFKFALGDRTAPLAQQARNLWNNLGPTLLINAFLLLAAIAAGHWWLYPLCWVVPLLTWQQAVTRIRNIAEHAVMPPDHGKLVAARTTMAGAIERVFLAPYWVNYHAEHHLLFYIPCYHLAPLHRALMAGPHAGKLEVRQSYREVLQLASSPKAAAQKSQAAYAGMMPL